MSLLEPVSYLDALWAPLAEFPQFGVQYLTLAGLPRRAYSDDELKNVPSLNTQFVDASLVERLPSFVEIVRRKLASDEPWLVSSRKAQLSLLAWFLLAEDPQRRLVVRDVSPLMHQLSLVEHVLADKDLTRVLIGDEVGLGKTVEAGLIVQRLLAAQPELRVLYLAPARLVRNVTDEFRRLQIDARTWVSGQESDARLDSDRVVIASIHKAVYESNAKRLANAGPWDLIIADECHHLSDWAEGGGSPNAGYKLVRGLVDGQRPNRGRLLLMSGTPHQGNQTRFENLLDLLLRDNEAPAAIAGRVIYRTKEMVEDWNGRPLFPKRDVRQPQLARLGREWTEWYERVGDLYTGPSATAGTQSGRARAGGWAKGQALQWAASSVSAGLGFLVRLAIRRLQWDASQPALHVAIEALRPYRGGRADEPVLALLNRLQQQIGNIENQEDAEDLEGVDAAWKPDSELLAELLRRGAELKQAGADAEKWRVMIAMLREAGDEKVVLFCQPVETVAVVAQCIEKEFGVRPSVIIGGQTEAERASEIERFRCDEGPRFIVSSKAGGEGLNLQKSRRLLHLDIPWNPMDMEQRVGRVHRFGSRQTIIVDTIVVPGTREADAYRIARDKLKLIAEQLEPAEFEMLFSRVMNLVPPEELAGVFGVAQPWSPGEEADRRIASIVKTGYEKLDRFTTKYAEGAKRIQQLETGSADWSDVRSFLKKSCNAEDAAAGTKPIFTRSDHGAVSTEASVQTVRAFGGRYVCDETDGLPCQDETGSAIPRLGTNSKAIVQSIRERICDQYEAGVASIKLSKAALEDLPANASGILMFAVQRYLFGAGAPEERDLSLLGFSFNNSGHAVLLPRDKIAGLVRNITSAERQQRPTIPSDLLATLANQLPTLQEQLRVAAVGDAKEPIGVWPISCCFFSAG